MTWYERLTLPDPTEAGVCGRDDNAGCGCHGDAARGVARVAAASSAAAVTTSESVSRGERGRAPAAAAASMSGFRLLLLRPPDELGTEAPLLPGDGPSVNGVTNALTPLPPPGRRGGGVCSTADAAGDCGIEDG
jgi:hypothetical protein